MSIEEMFPNVVGQKGILNKLKFFIDIQNSNGILPPILITGQRGSGKNTLAEAIVKKLLPLKDKSQSKRGIEINCSSIKTEEEFFNQIVNNFIVDQDVTIILDEIHSWEGTDLIDTFLSIWNTKQGNVNKYYHGGIEYVFDLSKISWIALTSEPNKLPETLLSRLEIFQLEELSLNDLASIVLKSLKGIKVENNDLVKDVASVSRNNGRESYKLGINIFNHLNRNNKDSFSREDWQEIKKQLGIRPNGINNIEYRVMKYLSNHENGASLSKLASALQLTNEATRIGFERFLLGNDYIEIVNAKGRVLTNKGRQYLQKVQE